VVKIDTQGFEPFVIKGSQRTIEHDRPVVFLEFWPFGYTRSGADAAWMVDFLLHTYHEMYVIDEEQDTVLAIDKEHVMDFTKLPGEAEGHRYLVFGL
jgi:hypothetical protein